MTSSTSESPSSPEWRRSVRLRCHRELEKGTASLEHALWHAARALVAGEADTVPPLQHLHASLLAALEEMQAAVGAVRAGIQPPPLPYEL